MEIRDKKGTENMVVDHLSRISDGKSEELPINDYFPYDMFVAFVRVEALCYAHIVDYFEEGSFGIKKNPKEAVVIARSAIPWYVDYINYLVAGVLPPDLTYQQKK